MPTSRRSPSQAGSIAAAVASLTSTSPACEASSSPNVAVVAGPVTISSRCVASRRNACTVPVWTPVDIRSDTGPTELIVEPACSMNHCMSTDARQARSAWPSPSKRISSASPRNLSTSPPWRSVIPISPSKTPLITRISSSEPARPFAARRSDSAVKPERSTETSVASSSRKRSSGRSRAHAAVSLGR